MIVLCEGDSREVLQGMIARGEQVDSVCCDPPYGLKSVVKRFGKEGYKPAKFGRDGAFSRASAGFMGQQWDGTGIENDPEFWGLVYQVLKPGGYIVAFSSSRTYHLMATALEVAGFITHPMIGWVYASGMPKAHNAAMAIDKALGAKGDRVARGNPVRRIRPAADQNKDGTWEKLEDREYQPGEYVPASEEAQAMDGWYYGGQVRKPAMEPIYVGQKPFSEKNGALNILKHGTGAVNIDAVRIPSEGGKHREGEASQTRDYRDSGSTNFAMKPGPRGGDPKGRWPANLIHDGSAEVVALFPESKGAKAPVKGTEPSEPTKDIYGKFAGRVPGTFYGDHSGSAARFYESYPFEGMPIFYHPKANKQDRAGSGHPTIKPVGLMRSLVRHITPIGGIVLDPFAGSGSTGEAAELEGFSCVLIEREQTYCRDIRRRFGISEPVTISITEYLSALGFSDLRA
ncbi:site-specific DNA-methyltransferase [Ochrobactrum sp. BTU2]|uniref:site-specific DNA-methyltransferase n=1 Tax=Ochrobactrum sp. BTU2 TaxID=2856166 RepID=UPI002119E431|nr:site-specific DNA-methyltransferase [Ochrobactrum sp. BTU2]MCQ9146069.1 site-specific DNA-methyltransferase [Ochrobactrum sp. BTU2]